MLTQRWGVWLGAVAILLAGVFLVRTALEQGWIGPVERCVAAAVLGFALVAAAEWMRRRPVTPAGEAAPEAGDAAPMPGAAGEADVTASAAPRSWPDQTPAALAAGGVAVLFGAAYGAAVLYGLVPPIIGFVMLAAAAVAGLALALVFGPLVAAVGLVGAYATPALVETADPSLPGLFAYLLAATVAALFVVRQVGAVWLGWCATVAAAGWVVAGGVLAGGTADLWAPALFVPAVVLVHLALLPGAALDGPIGRRLAWVPVAAMAAAGLALVPWTSGLAPVAGLLLLTPVTGWKGLREPRLDHLPWVAAAAGLVALLIWFVPDWTPGGEAVTAEGAVIAVLPTGPHLLGIEAAEALRPFLGAALALALLHAALGLWGERRGAHPVRWAGLVAAVPVLTLLIAYARVRGFAQDIGWAFTALALAAGLVGAATLAARARGAAVPGGDAARVPVDADDDAVAPAGQAADTPASPVDVALRRAGAHAAGAVAALSLGAAMVLSDQWLTLAVALLLPPLAWIEARADLSALRRVALAVAGVVIVRLLLNPFVLDYALGDTPVLNGILAAYGVPAIGFAVAAVLFRRRRDDATVAVLEAGACAFLGALALLLIRHALTGGDLKDAAFTFREVALDVLALWLLATGLRWLDARAGGRPVIGLAWRGYAVAGVLSGTGAILDNPAFATDEVLFGAPVFNEMALAYALPAVLALFAARSASLSAKSPLRPVLGLYGLVALFAWVTLTVRHRFHPVEMSLALEPVGNAELWAYSGAWLAFGAALLAVGIKERAKAPRLAALAVLGLTVGKVFLVDMSELTGLWRVVSFLGLGLALIALGRVYRRFVVVPPAPATAAGPAA
ncbi:DUF2339 domain-containing protein [Roseomonas sp. CCTCC AB2023176]|uniref:DUF2339 domain-containing protein n=1 Tax=Roseomonas sp. CCTCC AB2023176 TaxID=3342640 RepID=UPI0035DFD251